MIPVLWLAGPPGVGKTAVAWEVYQRLQRAGAHAAYVDVDQLGICYPPPTDDPERHALKARNVAVLRTSFAAAGANALVVSGVVDADRGPDLAALGGPPVVTVRLRAEPEELLQRLHGRDGASAQHGATLEVAKALDRTTFASRCIDTGGLTIGDAASRVLGDIGDWPPAADGPPPAAPPGEQRAAKGEILWVTGPPGVGKSTIAFRAYLQLLAAGWRAAYLDVGQLGFCSAAPDDHALRARNLAPLWTNFHAGGAQLAVVTGRLSGQAEARRYEQALPRASMTWRRLRVGRAELSRRILSRGAGGSWAEPGDALWGRSNDELLGVHAQSWSAAQQLDSANVGAPIDVDGLDVAAAAAALLAGWAAA